MTEKGVALLPGRRVRVVAPDGTTGTVEQAEAAQAQAAGFRLLDTEEAGTAGVDAGTGDVALTGRGNTVGVMAPDGTTGTIDRTDIQDAISKGFRLLDPEQAAAQEFRRKASVAADDLQRSPVLGRAQVAGQRLLSGATVGLSDKVLSSTGLLPAEDLAAGKQAFPGVSTASEIAGAIAPAIASGGATLAARGVAGVGGGVRAIGAAGGAVEGAVVSRLGTGAAARFAGSIARGGAEGAIQGGVQSILSDSELDPGWTATAAMRTAGVSALLGAALPTAVKGALALGAKGTRLASNLAVKQASKLYSSRLEAAEKSALARSIEERLGKLEGVLGESQLAAEHAQSTAGAYKEVIQSMAERGKSASEIAARIHKDEAPAIASLLQKMEDDFRAVQKLHYEKYRPLRVRSALGETVSDNSVIRSEAKTLVGTMRDRVIDDPSLSAADRADLVQLFDGSMGRIIGKRNRLGVREGGYTKPYEFHEEAVKLRQAIGDRVSSWTRRSENPLPRDAADALRKDLYAQIREHVTSDAIYGAKAADVQLKSDQAYRAYKLAMSNLRKRFATTENGVPVYRPDKVLNALSRVGDNVNRGAEYVDDSLDDTSGQYLMENIDAARRAVGLITGTAEVAEAKAGWGMTQGAEDFVQDAPIRDILEPVPTHDVPELSTPMAPKGTDGASPRGKRMAASERVREVPAPVPDEVKALQDTALELRSRVLGIAQAKEIAKATAEIHANPQNVIVRESAAAQEAATRAGQRVVKAKKAMAFVKSRKVDKGAIEAAAQSYADRLRNASASDVALPSGSMRLLTEAAAVSALPRAIRGGGVYSRALEAVTEPAAQLSSLLDRAVRSAANSDKLGASLRAAVPPLIRGIDYTALSAATSDPSGLEAKLREDNPATAAANPGVVDEMVAKAQAAARVINGAVPPGSMTATGRERQPTLSQQVAADRVIRLATDPTYGIMLLRTGKLTQGDVALMEGTPDKPGPFPDVVERMRDGLMRTVSASGRPPKPRTLMMMRALGLVEPGGPMPQQAIVASGVNKSPAAVSRIGRMTERPGERIPR